MAGFMVTIAQKLTMNSKINPHPTPIAQHQLLKTISAQLKTEFKGIDTVIDQVIELMAGWYIYPDLQYRPTVINLWGLTGVGKTSLVKRIVELLKMKKSLYRFDMGEAMGNEWSLQRKLQDANSINQERPLIMLLDEFQHAKAKDEQGMEIPNPSLRIVWDLLDSGKIAYTNFYRHPETFNEHAKNLILCLQNGVKVKGNRVVKNFKKYYEIMTRIDFHSRHLPLSEKNVSFIEKGILDDAYDVVKDNYENKDEFEKFMATLDGIGCVEFLQNCIEMGQAEKELNFAQSLIFVLGNIDEAYTMNDEFNPDMDADSFYRQSLKISVVDIKESLKKRFRAEQIARLGNNHIIYPALSKDAYYSIIDLELKKLVQSIQKLHSTELTFSTAFKDLIYREGVYPTQGTRPLFSTIHTLVKSKLSQLFLVKEEKAQSSTAIHFDYSNGVLRFDFIKGNKTIHSFSDKAQLRLEEMRQPKKDDLQAIVAVHESGHALLLALLLRNMPDKIISRGAGSTEDGFVSWSNNTDYIPRKTLLRHISVLLGGFLAEKLIYGEDNITMGSCSDISKATELALRAVKSSGFGKLPLKYSSNGLDTNFKFTSSNPSIEKEARQIVCEAMELAKRTLENNKVLLIELSLHLSQNPSMSKEEFIEFLLAHNNEGITAIDYLTVTDGLYQSMLKSHKTGRKSVRRITVETGIDFSLNHRKK